MPRQTTLPPRSHADLAAQVAAQFRQARFTQQDYLKDWAFHHAIDHAPQVTCAQLRQRAKQRAWSTDWLIVQVTGTVESPAATIKRIMGLADPAAVIPYTVLIDLYHGTPAASSPKRGECRCGCGQRVMGRQKFISDTHRKRAARKVA